MTTDPAAVYARNLTGYAYPSTEDVPGTPGMFRRKWILRVRQSVPAPDVLKSLLMGFVRQAREEIGRAYGEQGLTEEDLPRVCGFAIGEHYLVLEIDCPKAESAVGDSAAIGTWMLLRFADAEWDIIDVEGIPKQFWFALRTGLEKK